LRDARDTTRLCIHKHTGSLTCAEFGNYIGGDLDSDEDSEVDVDDVAIAPASVPSAPGPSAAATYAPLEGYDDEDEDGDEPMEETGMQMTLHTVDGECIAFVWI